jgi:hypothetical protein
MSISKGAASSNECGLCSRPIRKGQRINLHHTPILRSQGGDAVVEVHEKCHRQHHSTNNHFRQWGKIGGEISAISRQWSFNLLNVRTDPAHEINRQFYRMNYAH